MSFRDREVIDSVASSLRTRARRLRRLATSTLFIIVGVLAAGIAAFIFAGDLASREANRAIVEAKKDNLAFVEKRILDVGRDAEENRFVIRRYEEELALEERGIVGSKVPGKGAALASLKYQMDEARHREDEILRTLADLEQTRFKARDALAAAEAAPQPLPKDVQFSALISATTTRVGSVVLLIFLVQILVPLYRYNIRLAAFYEARADALSVLNTDDFESNEVLQGLVSLLSPDVVNFGNLPASPVEQVVELVKHLASVRGVKAT